MSTYPAINIKKSDIDLICRTKMVCDEIKTTTLKPTNIEFLTEGENGQVITYDAGVQTWADLPDYDLNELDDVAITTPTNNQALGYDSDWENVPPPTVPTTFATLTDVNVPSPSDTQMISYNSGTSKWVATNRPTTLNNINDVDVTGAADQQSFVYDGTQWINVTSMATVPQLNTYDIKSGANWKKLKDDVQMNNPFIQNSLGNFTDNSGFNAVIDIDGNMSVILAPADGNGSGIAYIYNKTELIQVITLGMNGSGSISNLCASILRNYLLVNFTDEYIDYSDYFEDFEASNGGWTAVNLLSATIWQYGTPASLGFSPGTKGWKTNISGDYLINTHTYLQSPLLTAPGAVSVELAINYVTENNFDGCNLWISLDGAAYQLLGTSVSNTNGQGTNWYNATTQASGGPNGNTTVWGNSSLGGVTATHILTNLSYTTSIQFRLYFRADNVVTFAGFYLNSFKVNYEILNNHFILKLYKKNPETQIFGLERTDTSTEYNSIILSSDYYAMANSTQTRFFSQTDALYDENIANPDVGLYNYGSVVDMVGTTVAVGARTYPTTGRVYVYDLVLGVWTLSQTLNRPGTQFGKDLKIENTKLVIANVDTIFVYLYNFNNELWEIEFEIPSLGNLSIAMNNYFVAVGTTTDVKMYYNDVLLNTFEPELGEDQYAQRITMSNDLLLVSSRSTSGTDVLQVVHYYAALHENKDKHIASLDNKTRQLCWIDSGTLIGRLKSDIDQSSNLIISTYTLPTYPTFQNGIIIKINDDSFQIWGKHQIVVNSPDVYTLSLPIELDNQIFPPSDKRIRISSVSGMFVGHFSDFSPLNGTILYNEVATNDLRFYFKSFNTNATLPDTANISYIIEGALIKDTTVQFALDANINNAAANFNNGGVDAVVYGRGPFTYLWSSSETTQDISNKPPDVYSVTVTDIDGSQTTNPYTINRIAQISNISITSTDASGTIAFTSPETRWDLAVGAENFTPLSATYTNITNPFTFGGLSPLTKYDVYIRQYTRNTADMWVGPIRMETRIELTGTYTVNSAAATDILSAGTNFQNFTDLAYYATKSFVSGPVTVNVTPGSGPYSEQVEFGRHQYTGSNRITINGNGEILEYYSIISLKPHVIKFAGSNMITINNLVIVGKGRHQWNVLFTKDVNDCNDISITNCYISCLLAGSNNSYLIPIVSTDTFTEPTATNGHRMKNIIIDSCEIVGGMTGILFRGDPTNLTSTGAYQNVVKNCTIRDQLSVGIQFRSQVEGLIQKNNMHRKTYVGPSGTYNFIILNENNGLIINRNNIHDPFGLNPALATSSAGGIGFESPLSLNVTICNNLIHNFNLTNGSQGITSSVSGNTFSVYGNTMIFLGTSTSAIQNCIVHTSAAATGYTYRILNNVFYVNRTTSGSKTCVNLASTFNSANTIMNYNMYFITPGTASTNRIAAIGGVTYTNLQFSNLQAAGFETNGYYTDSLLRANNIIPQTSIGNNTGLDLTSLSIPELTFDYYNVARTSTPDIGAIQRSAFNIQAPSGLVISSITYNSAQLAWTENGSATLWNIEIVPRNTTPTGIPTYSGISTNPYVMTSLTEFTNYEVYIQSDNVTQSYWAGPLEFTTLRNLSLGGVYTINQAANTDVLTAGTNFKNFTDFADILLNSTITSSIVVNVSNGPYNENVLFRRYDLNVAKTITINGNGHEIRFHNASSSVAHTIRFIGSVWININNLKIASMCNAAFTLSFLPDLFNNACSDINITNCYIQQTYQGNSGGVLVAISNSYISATTEGHEAKRIVFNGCKCEGGTRAFSLQGNRSNLTVTGAYQNVIKNCEIYDHSGLGILLNGQVNCLIQNNKLHRLNLPHYYYGFTITAIESSSGLNNIIDRNSIHDYFPSNLNDTDGTFTGILLSVTSGTVNNNTLISNNLIYNINHNGQVTGINVNSASVNIVSIYYNNISFVKTSNAGSSDKICIRFTQDNTNPEIVKNNVLYINNASSGIKTLFSSTVLALVPPNLQFNYNHIFNASTGGTNRIASIGAVHYSTSQFATLQGAGYQVNGFYSDPYPIDAIIPQTSVGINVGQDVSALFVPYLTFDYYNASRSATPDMGATERGLFNQTAPHTLSISSITNNSAQLAWIESAGGIISWNIEVVLHDTIPTGVPTHTATTNPYVITGLANLTSYDVYIQNNNGSTLSYYNGPINFTTKLNLTLGGSYTINSADPTDVLSSGTNFANFHDLSYYLDRASSVTNMVIDVVIGSGPYYENVQFNRISGLDSNNKITINGQGEEIISAIMSNLNVMYAIRLYGANWMTFNDLIISGYPLSLFDPMFLFHLLYDQYHNYSCQDITINNCTIQFINNNSTGDSSCIIANAFISSAIVTSAFPVHRNILINECKLIRGSNGVIILGNSTNLNSTQNIVQNCEIRDILRNSVYMTRQTDSSILTNHIHRSTNTVTPPGTYYGVYTEGCLGLIVTRNRIHDPFKLFPTSTVAFIGMAFDSNTKNVIIANNLIYNVTSNGTMTGIDLSIFTSNGINYICYNTIILSGGAASFIFVNGIYHVYGGSSNSTRILNNVINIYNQNPSSEKVILNLAGPMNTTNDMVNYNHYYNPYTAAIDIIVDLFGITYNTTQFTSYQTDTGFDLNSYFAITNATDGIPRAQTNIGYQTGLDLSYLSIPSFNVDFYGNPRSATPSIGAIERSAYVSDAPSGLTISNISTGSAMLSWTAPLTTMFIEVVSAGEVPTGTATYTTIIKPFTMTGLDPSTSYDVYIRTGTSYTAGPVSFTTLNQF